MFKLSSLMNEIRFTSKANDGSKSLHVIDRGGNYKLNGRVMNPVAPKYADQYDAPLSNNYPVNIPDDCRVVEVTGQVDSYVYLDRDLHKTVRMERNETTGEFNQTIL